MKNLLVLLAILFLPFKNNGNSIPSSTVKNLNNESNLEQAVYNSPTENIKTVLYKGTLNQSITIWLYINDQAHPCGGNLRMVNAMYKYDSQEKWILLSVTKSKDKIKYCMVEDNFTGVLFLEESENSLNGKWISPNTKDQFNAALQQVELDKETNENLEEILFDDLLYNKNDC